ncbi:MAG: hypothetical protein IJ700_07290 [Bacteroidaceae bacterium]|nr:hypothetical protein [Bacteroidaceae bacterium]
MDRELKDLVSSYCDPILPMLHDIKRRNKNKIPDNCLNEIRAIVDHIARCYRTDDPVRIEKEMGKAEGHMQRLAFDCFKQLNIFLHDGLESKIKWFFSPYWLHIDGGEFWKKFYNDRQMIIKTIVLAKENESLDADLAMSYYAQVYEGYFRIEKLLNTHKLQLCWSLVVRLYYLMSHFTNWFLITAVLALISAIISYFIS